MGKDMGALHPIFRDRLQQLFDATGCYANSTWRSSQEQQYLRDCYVNCNCNNCNPANEPGTSNHEAVPWGEAMGLAADIGGDLNAAHDMAADFGLHFPIVSVEPWHIQPQEVPYAYYTGLPEGWGDSGRYTIRQGAKGQLVTDCQNRLNVHGYGVVVDGDFGPVTTAVVRQFQVDHGLDSDGVVGALTWEALDAEPGSPPLSVVRQMPGELRMSSQGAALIARHEGLVLHLYNDPVGHCTVGIGHLVHHGNCDGSESEGRWAGRDMSNEEAYKLFVEEDAPRYEDGVRRHIQVPLFQSEFDALVSFSFNLGADILDESDCTLARLLNRSDYEGASNEFGKWVNASGVRLEGLVRRRAEERELFRSSWNGSATPTPEPDGAPGWPGRNLRRGMTGTDVSTFQAKLAERGWDVTVDGDFGVGTEGVVIAFQQDKDLIADGIVGADTWWAIWHSEITAGQPPTPAHPSWPDRYLRYGDWGPEVRTFQARLFERGWRWLDADGVFGSSTQTAVIQFQQEKGLTVDGVVGPSTWNSLWTAPIS